MKMRKGHEAKSGGGKAKRALAKPAFKGWVTSDTDEIEARRQRAGLESMEIRNIAETDFYGDFSVASSTSKLTYRVEIRSLTSHGNACTCGDFRHNGLGTCKHVEAVLARLRKKGRTAFTKAVDHGSPLVEIYLDRRDGRVKVAWPRTGAAQARQVVGPFFGADNVLLGQPLEAIPAMKWAIEKAPASVSRDTRPSQDLLDWFTDQCRHQELQNAREAFLGDVASGKQTFDLVKAKLYPYQQEGMLHLAFGERVMLADDMGLGKTVQAIAACELLRRSRGIQRVLVVSPASLKAEWEEQIAKFTGLQTRIVWGGRASRLKIYREPSFFYLCNYEQAREDYIDINSMIAPDVVILDEAQRIKNWQTKTAKHIKRLASPFAFVLTGTPLENRIDEVYSIVDFLDSSVFGPLFRFNREFYNFDERGRPLNPKNLPELHRRLKTIMLRRKKDEVEDELPDRTVNNYFVAMEDEQRERYSDYEGRVAKLMAIAQRRPLMKEESEKLQRWLACMRMICDSPFILDQDCRICPKLGELEKVFEDLTESKDNKIIVFSEWERMLQLVRGLAGEMELPFAWHTGSVPQQKRRADINRFKQDPDCRLFLSTDAGATGLNLQAANVVINMDLPWNPARLEQRIARAWRKHQTRAVSVINMVCENSIEHRMLATLAGKQQLADGVLDGKGDLENIGKAGGRAVFMERLGNLMGVKLAKPAEVTAAPGAQKPARAAATPEQAFKEDISARLGPRLLLLESRPGPKGQATLMAVVDGDAAQTRPLAERVLQESFQGVASAPALEVLDRATYDTIKRLIEAGVLKLETGGATMLHREPGMAGEAAREQERLRKAAEPFIEQASKKARMATLLGENGFAAEALPAWRDGVEFALRAAACLCGESPDAHAQGVPLSYVESVLRERHLVLPDVAGIVARLRETASAKDAVVETALAEMAAKADRLVTHVSEAFSRAAMK